jgi:hypothetical protein
MTTSPAVIVMGIPAPDDASGVEGELASVLVDVAAPAVAGDAAAEPSVLSEEHPARATTVTATIADTIAFLMAPADRVPYRRRSHCLHTYCQPIAPLRISW